MVRLLLSLVFSIILASTASANLCVQSLNLIKSIKNSSLEMSSQVINKLVKKRVLRETSELDTAFVEKISETYHMLLESGKSQQEVANFVILNMNVTPVAEIRNGQVLQLEHILAFEHAKKLAGLTTTSLYDEWKALESVDKKVFVFFNNGSKRKIKIKTRRVTKGYVPKALYFLFSFQFKVKVLENTVRVGTVTNLKMRARGFSDPKLILPRRSPKDISEMVEYTWQLSKKMHDIRFASQFILPSFYTIGTYPLISANGAPHTPINFDTRQMKLANNTKQALARKNYVGAIFYQGQLFLSQFGKAFTKDYRNKVIGALAYHDARVYEMLSSLRTLKPAFMPLKKRDKRRMGGIRNHVYGMLSMLMPNPTPRLNRIGVHRVNQQDYNEIFDIYGEYKEPQTAEHLAAKYNKKFGTKLNYKWAANNIGRMWFATFAAFTLAYTPQIYAVGKNINIPVAMEMIKVVPGVLWDLGSDVYKGVDRNAEAKADSYAGQIQLWNIFDATINGIYTATENQQQLWDNYWDSGGSFFESKWDSYVMAYKLLNGQSNFVKTAESAIKQLKRENNDLSNRANNPQINQIDKTAHEETIKENNQKIESLKQRIEASSQPEFVKSLEQYLHHFQKMEADKLAEIRQELGNPSEADFMNALEIYLNNQ